MAERLFDSNGNPIITTITIQRKLFYYAGLLMAQSFWQGGPTPNILSSTSFAVVSSNGSVQFKLEELPDNFKNETPIKEVHIFDHLFFVFCLRI